MNVRDIVGVACCLVFTILLPAQRSNCDNLTPKIVCTIPRGKIVHMVQPIYPPKARVEHLEGDVVLQLRLAKDGTVEKIMAVSGDPTLAESAEQAVTQWRYRQSAGGRDAGAREIPPVSQKATSSGEYGVGRLMSPQPFFKLDASIRLIIPIFHNHWSVKRESPISRLSFFHSSRSRYDYGVFRYFQRLLVCCLVDPAAHKVVERR